jgi:outer membrane immunogenic protein
MKLRLLALASAAVVIATSASAADLGRRVAPVIAAPAPVYNWSGLYVGVHGGGAWADTDSTFQSGLDSDADFDLDGAVLGAQIGYNFLVTPNILLGIEADAAWGNINGREVVAFGPTEVTQSLDSLGSVRARLGFVQGPWLFYATGGWAWANGERTAFGPLVDDSDSANFSGWTVGAGVEVALSQKLSVKAEYKYYDFGSADYFDGTPGASTLDVTAHAVTVGLNFKLF